MTIKDYNGNKVTVTENETRVKLYAENYAPRRSNPVVGSEHECEGLVIELFLNDQFSIRVLWDNGNDNRYNGRDLLVINSKENKKLGPNQAYKISRAQKESPQSDIPY